MINMLGALWLPSINLIAWAALLVFTVVWASTLRLTVGLVAKDAENSWDNAIGYALVTLLLTVPIRWILGLGSWILIGLIPVGTWIIQVWALKYIYELKTARAFFVSTIQSILAWSTMAMMTVFAGAIAAYILYGRIISDPMFLIRLLLRIIGIELPVF